MINAWVDLEDFICTYVDSRGRSGGLGLLWKKGGLFGDVMWRFTGFYGWPKNTEKHLSWELTREIKASSSWDGPWLCAGDFDQILYNEEKLGCSLREQSVMGEFKEALEDCGLMDLGYVGFEYTWWNGREGDDSIHERLDRMVGNNKWLEEFPLLTVYHLNQGDSDHLPLKLVEYKGNKNMRRKGYSFKFEDYWLTSDQCGELWEVSEALKKWSRKEFGNIQMQIKEKKEKLTSLANCCPTPTVQCGWKEEDVVHTLIQCPAAQNIWEAMQIEVNFCNQDYHVRFVEWWDFILSNFSSEEASKTGMICWGLWNARNENVFKGNPRAFGDVVGSAMSYLNSFMEANGTPKSSLGEADAGWQPPPRGVVKINCDVGFLGNGMVGLGAVEWSAQVAEAKAILFGVKVALHGGYDNNIVKSDCLQVINYLQKGVSYFSDLAIVISDVLSYCSSFISLSWIHVKRKGNVVAHIMAKLSPVEIGERCWFWGARKLSMMPWHL
ncbi:hypothetical protein RDABS01_011062, partial [Bienertia sinuspersici]